jgi:hypothetical protein
MQRQLSEPITHPVYRSLNIRMLVGYCDLRWFLCGIFLAMTMFSLLKTFVGAAVMFLFFYGIGCIVGAFDPQIILFVWTLPGMRPIYDAAKI